MPSSGRSLQASTISVDDVTDDELAVVRMVRALATQVVPADNNTMTFTAARA